MGLLVPSSGMRLSVATIFFCFLKIVGLAPFSLHTKMMAKTSPKASQACFTFSKIGLVYGLALSITLAAVSIVAYPDLLSSYDTIDIVTVKITDVITGTLASFTALTIIVYWVIKQRSAVSIMNRLLEVKLRLSDLRMQPANEKRMTKSLIVQCAFHISLWIITSLLHFIFDLPLAASVTWLFFNIPFFIIYWFLLEYVYVVKVVGLAFTEFNELLLNFHDFQSHFNPTTLISDYLPILNSSIHSHLADLQVLRNIRTRISEVSQDIADFFSLPVLPCITCVFISIVINLYYLTVITIYLHNPPSLQYIIDIAIWMQISLVPVTLLLLNISETLKQAKLSGCVISRLLDQTVKRDIRVELQQFSLELLHENISFNACGFFTLNFMLLHSIFGATATYIVILIQFQSANKT